MIETLQNIDTQIFLTLNSLRCEAMDGFVYGFSGPWIWVPMYVVLAWMMVRRYGWRTGLIFIAVTCIVAGCSDFVCASLIRPYVQRLRPANPANPISEMVNLVAGYRGGSYGFPSCHAANSIALALITSLLMKKCAYTIFIFTWAVLQCYSRIYLGVHYPGDMLAGAIVGTVISLLAYWLIRAKFHCTPSRKVSLLPLSAMTAILIIVIIITT